jgi:hypothetical protein
MSGIAFKILFPALVLNVVAELPLHILSLALVKHEQQEEQAARSQYQS